MKSVPFFVLLVACSSDSSSDGPAGASGFPRDRTVASLSNDEVAKLCEWALATQGGEGKVTECGGGASEVVHTKPRCIENIGVVKSLESCYPVTVGEVEDCSIAEGNEECTNPTSCKTLNDRIEPCAERK